MYDIKIAKDDCGLNEAKLQAKALTRHELFGTIQMDFLVRFAPQNAKILMVRWCDFHPPIKIKESNFWTQ